MVRMNRNFLLKGANDSHKPNLGNKKCPIFNQALLDMIRFPKPKEIPCVGVEVLSGISLSPTDKIQIELLVMKILFSSCLTFGKVKDL